MKVLQPKLSLGSRGKVLVDSTNVTNSNVGLSNLLNKDGDSRKRKNNFDENFAPAKIGRKDGIYTDPPVIKSPAKSQIKKVDAAVQTEDSGHYPNRMKKKGLITADMLTGEETSPVYWESLAEKRRVALEVTLKENAELVEENNFLKEENKILEGMVQEAKELALLVQEVSKDAENATTESKFQDEDQLDDTLTNDSPAENSDSDDAEEL